MQPNEVEVVFCDLCGASVPAADLASQAAVPFQGKVVGACCLGALRSAGAPTAATPRAAAGDGRLLTIAIAMLAGLAAVAIFLDQKVADVDRQVQDNHEQVLQRLGAGGEVLQSVSMSLDGAARKSDLDALAERLGVVEGGLMAAGEQDRQVLEQLRQGVAGLQQQQQRRDAATIDYRPLFDDLRQQLQRQAAAIAELRTSAAAHNVAEAAVPPPEVPVPDPSAASGLPPAIQALVAKLGSSDPALRFEAVDELVRSKEPAVLPHLLPLARDPDAFVRRLTVEVLRDFKHVDAVEALLVALGDGDENVRDTAWRSLRELTGQKLPFEATASKDARARAQQKWQEWWDKNKTTFGS